MYRKNRRLLNSTGFAFCEICQEETFLVQHHILGKKIHKPNRANNLANICSNCHLKVHKAELIIEKRVMTNKGYVLLWHIKSEQSISGDDAKPYTY